MILKTSKLASTYASALFNISCKNNTLHQIVGDFVNLNTIFTKSAPLKDFLTNSFINKEQKRDVLIKIVKNQINIPTLDFLMLLVDRNVINYLPEIVTIFLELVHKTAKVITVEVSTASKFTEKQTYKLIEILKKLTNAREVKLKITLDPSLIGGFLVKRDSKIINLTVKDELKQLANFLNLQSKNNGSSYVTN